MSKSNIEWTEQTWNPIVGCSIKSPGCKNCYAMPMAARIEAMNAGNIAKGKAPTAPHYDGTTKIVNGKPVFTGKLARAPASTLLAPLRRKKPTTYFVNSMGDLFHDDCPDEWIDEVFAVMVLTPWHDYQVLTKRAGRMKAYCSDPATARRIYELACEMVLAHGLDVILIADPAHEAIAPPGPRVRLGVWPIPNVWLGVSTERQQEADERIPLLLQTPAAVRFISAEPLIGPIDLMGLINHPVCSTITDALQGCVGYNAGPDGEGRVMWDGAEPCPKLDWVIVGGESGAGARPMSPGWARDLRDQCDLNGVKYFFKQWGAHAPSMMAKPDQGIPRDSDNMVACSKKSAGRMLDGVEHNAMPARAQVPA